MNPLPVATFTAVVAREGRCFVALCPELDVVSQGSTVEKATANLREAVELFLECVKPAELRDRLHSEVFVTRFDAHPRRALTAPG
jgi:predicted RNase H-like HicB family nuclease